MLALGYGHWDYDKRGHNTFTKQFPDYTLLHQTPHKWILEVKQLDLPLGNAETKQAVDYANDEGVQWAVLTNGRQWYIFNNHLHVPLPEKKVFEIADLFADNADLTTLALLSKTSMLANGLREAWTFHQVQSVVKSELETAHSSVRNLLSQLAANETGTAISDAVIGQSLRSLSPTLPIAKANTATPAPTPPSPALKSATNTAQTFYTFAQIAANSTLGTGRKPSQLQFASETPIAVTTWADVAIKTVERVGHQFGLPQLPFSNRAKGKTYFLNTQPNHSTGQAMKGHRKTQVNGNTIYMDTNRSTQEIMNSLLTVFTVVKVPPDFVKVSIG